MNIDLHKAVTNLRLEAYALGAFRNARSTATYLENCDKAESDLYAAIRAEVDAAPQTWWIRLDDASESAINKIKDAARREGAEQALRWGWTQEPDDHFDEDTYIARGLAALFPKGTP